MNSKDNGSGVKISSIGGWIVVYLLILSILVIVIMQHIGIVEDYTIIIAGMAGILVLIYILLLVRSILSDTLMFIKDKKTVEQALNNISNGRLAIPYVTIKVTCADYNKSGKGVSLERCVDIPIARCVDASGDINPMVFQQGQFTRVSGQLDTASLSPVWQCRKW